MFEQHERWLEELLEYTNRKESLTCSSGHMPLTAIAQEIATACADTATSQRAADPKLAVDGLRSQRHPRLGRTRITGARRRPSAGDPPQHRQRSAGDRT